MALTHDELRENARAARQPYFIDEDRINPPIKISTDMINATPDVLKKTPILVDHAVHDMYKIEPGSKVFVANTKMFLKGHITKKVTIFSREQLVIGEKMKHWLPFEFGSDNTPVSQATPIQLFDLGYYVFETDNAKWPHMIVPKSLFTPSDQSMELQAIKEELDKLHGFKQALEEDRISQEQVKNFERFQDQDEENAKNIEALKKHLWPDKPKLKPEKDFDTWTNFLAAGPDEDEIWMANDQSMGINLDDLGPMIPPIKPSPDGFGELTKKQQKALTKKQICPDCKHRAEFLAIEGPSGGALTTGGMRGALVTSQKVWCGNCKQKFDITGVGGFGAERI